MTRKPSSAESVAGAIEPERYEFFESPRYRFQADRRDFFKILGAGIVVCFVVGESDAFQQQARRRRGGGRGLGRAMPRELARGCTSTRRAK